MMQDETIRNMLEPLMQDCADDVARLINSYEDEARVFLLAAMHVSMEILRPNLSETDKKVFATLIRMAKPVVIYETRKGEQHDAAED